MTEAEARLKALFAEDEPPPRDAAFSAAVMERVMRRRFALDVARLAGVTVLGGVVSWATWPVLVPLIAGPGPGLTPVAACLAVAATMVLLIEGRFFTAPPET